MMGYFVGDGWIQETKKLNTLQITFSDKFLSEVLIQIKHTVTKIDKLDVKVGW
jgi:hypothetical protein